MRRKSTLFLVVLLCLIIFNAHSQAEDAGVKVINGVTHVYNPVDPIKGEVTLNPEKFLSLDPAKMEGGDIEDLYFDNFERDEEGNVYLIDGTHIAIYKFSPAGKYLVSFLKRGEGPGEVEFLPNVQVIGKDTWVLSAYKFVRYDQHGIFSKEFRFIKFLTSVTIIDENQFVANYFQKHGESKDLTKRIGLFSIRDGKNILNYFESEHIGSYFAKFGKRKISINPPVGIIPDIIYAIDLNTGRVYVSLNRDYEITARNLNGDIELIIHREAKNPVLAESDKEDIINSFGSLPENVKKSLIASLPDKQCVIRNIEPLSNGHILVRQIVGYEKDALDVFSKDGKYLYRIKLPKTLNLKNVKFYKGILSGIEEREDTNVYHEYKIKSLPGLF